jgi:HPt (histidine-containing phosphotransfer) domain-containing protein
MIRDISDRLITELILHIKKLEKRIMDTTENLNFTNEDLQKAQKSVVSKPNDLQGQVDESVLDLGALQAIREMGGEDGDFVLNNIIQMYLETTPPYLQQIETAIATGDPDSLRRASHSLGSSSATLGAINFAKLCKALENLARSGSIAPAENLLFPLQTEYETVKRALTLQLKDLND